VNPVVALLLGAWLAHEPLGVRTLLATPVILLGLALVLRSSAAPAQPRPADQNGGPSSGRNVSCAPATDPVS
ncbi:MAG TPA: hypothetical protein VE091_08800, partial [Gemmatimonadales bacterium]|nr:hypothetical protein [Gemmatimonadales bacterium]